MAPRHHVLRAGDVRLTVPQHFQGHSEGFRRCAAIDGDAGSVHMGFGICELDTAGSVPWHISSHEESFYVLDGEVVCDTEDGAHLLRPGDYGVISVGAAHAWRNLGDARVRWADMLAPQPRSDPAEDTFLCPRQPADAAPIEVDPRDPRTRSFGHIDPANLDPGRQTQELLSVSASMRTALLVYSGISVKMMVDRDLGADLSTMFLVQYEPRGVAGAHDHPLEEAYLILDGEVHAVFDGQPYHLLPGDIGFAGVGCTHEFSNPAEVPVRWLETQAPQPPARHSYRFARDWNYLRTALGDAEA